MGRYDKIQVYDGSNWRQPTQIRVYNNGIWESFGEADSSNTKTLSVRKDNNFVRATLNKTVTEIPGSYYTTGVFALTKTDSKGRLLRYCHEKSKGDWYFRATIRRTSDTEKNIYTLANSSNSTYVKIKWNANGTITATNYSHYEGTAYSVTTTNAVGSNQWVTLDITAPKGGSKVTIKFNGVSTTGNFYGTWYNNSVSYTIGATGLHFKNNMSLQGMDYNNGLIATTINMSSSSDVAANCSGYSFSYDGSTNTTWT